MRYIVKGEGYDRGWGEGFEVKFQADNDSQAKIKLVAMGIFGHSGNEWKDVSHTQLQHEFLEDLDEKYQWYVSEHGLLDEDLFADIAVEQILEPMNGDGMDYFAALENLDTGDIVWGDPEDANLVNYDYDE